MKEKPSLDRWSLLEQAGTVLDEQFHHDAIYWHLVETAAYGRQLEAEITRLRTEGERLRLTNAKPIAWQVTDAYGPIGAAQWMDGETRWPKNQNVPLYLTPPPTLTDAKPVLWTLDFDGDPLHPDFVFASANEAENFQRHARSKCKIVSLYRDPPPPTLTDAQRDALEWAATEAESWATEDDDTPEIDSHAAAIRGLLARHGGER